MESTATPLPPSSSAPLKLLVGSQSFTTSLATLTSGYAQGSMLAAMFSGSYHLEQHDGHYFLDRDGDLFKHVLLFLRSGFLPSTLDLDTATALLLDAQYFGLVSMINVLQEVYPFAGARAAALQEVARGTNNPANKVEVEGSDADNSAAPQPSSPEPPSSDAMVTAHRLSELGALLPRLQLSPTAFLQLYIHRGELGDQGLKLDGLDLRQLCLAGLDLSYASLARCDLRNCDLQHCNLENALLRDADLSGADLTHASLIQTDLTGVVAHNTCFEQVSAQRSCFAKAQLHHCSFRGADLLRSSFTNAVVLDGDFEKADQRFMNRTGSNLQLS
eukprot:m.24345 g.24345  ORF g.24345 m.24345 type:complete len:331 (-) comp11498_c0_seq2:41-1033(-)